MMLYAAPQSWLEALHPEDRPRVQEAALTKQIAGEYDEEYRIIRPDGPEEKPPLTGSFTIVR